MHVTKNPVQGSKTAANTAPQVWLVLGDKRGDNAQVEAIIEALGWPYERKQLYFRAPYVIDKPRFRASLQHLDTTRSDLLLPPWPDLVLTIGLRPAMAALWLREQSGGRTKIVLIDKPDGRLDQFTLVVVNAAHRLPKRPNVLWLELPLMRANAAAIAKAVTMWQPRLAVLPRPLIALLVGGPTGPFVFDAIVASRLVDMAGQIAAHAGGTLYITTSPRTPPTVVEALRAGLPAGAHLYCWTAGSTDNPYLGLLGLADRFIVTGDSVSMMVEVARLGKPLAIFPLPHRQRGVGKRLVSFFARRLLSSAMDGPRSTLLQTLGYRLYRWGLLGRPRDLMALHRVLITRGLAVPLGEDFPSPGQRAPDDLPRVAARIRRLLDTHSGAPPTA
jgi:mitochondrial fission protein ELM1